jgi:hypothetical protein
VTVNGPRHEIRHGEIPLAGSTRGRTDVQLAAGCSEGAADAYHTVLDMLPGEAEHFLAP